MDLRVPLAVCRTEVGATTTKHMQIILRAQRNCGAPIPPHSERKARKQTKAETVLP